MEDLLAKATEDQISSIQINYDLPMIISDADEVLVIFMKRFELFLTELNCYFNWASFKLTGNIIRHTDDHVFSQKEVFCLLDQFFKKETLTLDAVPGAKQALNELSTRAQVIILSNVPYAYREERIECLNNHGMDYPVVVNAGPKGPAVKALAEKTQGPVFFIDDSPNNIKSVAEVADGVRRIHFIHDIRLGKLIGTAPHSHYHSVSWTTAKEIIDEELRTAGF